MVALAWGARGGRGARPRGRFMEIRAWWARLVVSPDDLEPQGATCQAPGLLFNEASVLVLFEMQGSVVEAGVETAEVVTEPTELDANPT